MVPGAAAPADGVPDTRVSCPLEDPGPVWPGPVGDAGDRRLWEAMMAGRHPQGWARSPGGQTRYWIRSERHGVPGASASGRRPGSSGRAMNGQAGPPTPAPRTSGASCAATAFPSCPASASTGWRRRRCAWRRRGCVGRLGIALFGASGGSLHACQRESQRIPLPPRRLDLRRPDQRAQACGGEAGTVRVTALEDGWREALHHAPRRPVGALAGACDGADMDRAERECGRSGHTDGRARRRIVEMGRAWLDSMGADLPAIFPVKADRKGAYRLLSNDGVTMRHVLEPQCDATADRCRGERAVLAIQDTTAPTARA